MCVDEQLRVSVVQAELKDILDPLVCHEDVFVKVVGLHQKNNPRFNEKVIGETKTCTTPLLKGGLKPHWTKHFHFFGSKPSTILLKFEVYIRRILRGPKLVGQGHVLLDELWSEAKTGLQPMPVKLYKVCKHSDKIQAGVLMLDFGLVTKHATQHKGSKAEMGLYEKAAQHWNPAIRTAPTNDIEHPWHSPAQDLARPSMLSADVTRELEEKSQAMGSLLPASCLRPVAAA